MAKGPDVRFTSGPFVVPSVVSFGGRGAPDSRAPAPRCARLPFGVLEPELP